MNETMRIDLHHYVESAVEPSARVLQTAAMFGLGVDDARTLTIVPKCTVDIPTGAIIFITGPSGGGKSTVLRLLTNVLRTELPSEDRLVLLDALPQLRDVSLVDVFNDAGLSLAQTTSLLAMAGLGDAFVMLRKPSELSDGQRHRLRLAQAMQRADQCAGSCYIIADEFAATLDRLTAQLIARQLRRWTRAAGNTFILATTHDDLLEALEPDVLIYKGLGDQMDVLTR